MSYRMQSPHNRRKRLDFMLAPQGIGLVAWSLLGGPTQGLEWVGMSCQTPPSCSRQVFGNLAAQQWDRHCGKSPVTVIDPSPCFQGTNVPAYSQRAPGVDRRHPFFCSCVYRPP